jgi:uncharacterized protein YpmS
MPHSPASALLKRIYQALTWTTLAALLLSLLLVLRKSPPPAVAYDANAAARAEQKLEAADQAKASGQPAAVALDRSELNSFLAQNLELGGQPAPAPTPSANSSDTAAGAPAGGPPPGSDPTAALTAGGDPTLEQVQSSVKDVKVDMEGDIAKAYVVFNFHGKELSLELNGRLHAVNGYLQFDPVSGSLGSMPLPQSALQSAVERMMDSPENREKLRLPPDISDIQIVNGQAVITYK